MIDTSNVFIFNTIAARPVYHAYGRITVIDLARDGDVTKCGLLMYDGSREYVRAALRRDHADRFARPCGKCFRGES